MKFQASILPLFLLVVFFCACHQESTVSEAETIMIAADDLPTVRAQKIRQQLLQGASFPLMAKEYSDDPGSAQYGGNLGTAHFGQFVPEFESAIQSLKPGEISEPVRTKFGYHLIELIAKDETTFTSRHILIKP
ncbi:MAG: peptidylprolyl isomerase [Bacteroidota bacterium]